MTKLKGWIVYNGNLREGKFLDFANWVKEAASRKGIEAIIIKNNELLVTVENGKSTIKGPFEHKKPDFVIFGDKDILLARQLEALGVPVFNSADSIEKCDHKGRMYQVLADHQLPVPKTIIAPMIFSGMDVIDDTPYRQIGEELGYPLVIKEAYGSFGQQVYLIEDAEALLVKIKQLGGTPYVLQEYIQTSHGKDIRLNVVGEKIVASMIRKSSSDFRANVSAGGKMETYFPSEEEKELAIACSRTLGTNFAGVDLLFGENDKRYICEVNSNAHIRSIFDCTGINVADTMIDFIIEKLKESK
ncbi:ATP-grasp domain-containing protein [Bacillus sp. FJAT-45350]|uniref:ATP-grasp domain-containing protein n=1 Tax=Bacillus sp. FJAT-45350 TaxID=2011014 RepID=UPI000BB71A76|nr:RimK family alpha-L-glutamate ligase [Bacillus sp. FJAT-45350]